MTRNLLIALGVVLAVIVVCKSHWLSNNTFLMDFIGYEVLAIMAIILTVTLASVANINLSINQMVANSPRKDDKNFQDAANDVKREVKETAWYIFWGFVGTTIVLLVKGLNEQHDIVIAVSNGLIVWVLFLYIACMHDIYSVSFGMDDL